MIFFTVLYMLCSTLVTKVDWIGLDWINSTKLSAVLKHTFLSTVFAVTCICPHSVRDMVYIHATFKMSSNMLMSWLGLVILTFIKYVL